MNVSSGSFLYHILKLIQLSVQKTCRVIIFILYLDKFVCTIGFNDYAIRETEYLSKVTFTDFYVYANNKFPIESAYTKRNIKDETFLGIKTIAEKSFDCIDIGANVGTHSLLMAKYCRGKVFAFEPAPSTFTKLIKNVSHNSLSEKIHTKNVGISNRKETLHYAATQKNKGNGHLFKNPTDLIFKDENHLGEIIPNIPCDELDVYLAENLNQINKIDFIKIDIESMEYEAILGARGTIIEHMPAILVETTKTNSDVRGFDCVTPMFSFLYSFGYESFSFKNSKFKKFIYPNFSGDTFFLAKNTLEVLDQQLISLELGA
jgi:FkbM family methyltransferase